MVRTRTDGANDLIRFRSRENEDEVLWWLLHNLQQRVKALVSNHVGFVDDEDAVAGIRWRVISALTQLTHIFHGVMRCRIQLRDIQVARPTGRQCNTASALATGLRRWALHAV